MSKECKVGKLCKTCDEKGHMLKEYRKKECCRNCSRMTPSDHSLLVREWNI